MSDNTMPVASDEPSRSLPKLDLDEFRRGDSKARQEFSLELVSALRTVGFVKLLNHGISQEKVKQAFKWNEQFFALPLDAKNKAAHPLQANPHRGYSYVGQEKLSKVKDYEKGNREGVVVNDIKESFDQGPTDDDLYPNRWPHEADIPGFRAFMESLYDSCHLVHVDLLQALSIGLGLEPAHLEALCRQNTSELRLNHYPACDASALRKGANRISEHTDFGVVTLLFQDMVGGLEVEDQSSLGSYFPVPCEGRDEMIVNIGDCLQRWTNDRLRSTSHRVVLPPAKFGGAGRVDDRYSIAYFSKPNRSQAVGVLPEFLEEGETSRYENITAWEYNQEKLVLTY